MENVNKVDDILEGYDDVDFLDSGEFIGPQDILILVSRQQDTSTGLPRKQGQFCSEDGEKLASEKIPKEYWNDEVKIMEARFQREKAMFKRKRNVDVIVQVESEPNMTVGTAVDSIIDLMQARTFDDRMKGVLICYFGNGRKSDGAWCFKHGHITFDLILQLYKEFKRGRLVMVISDCPASYCWVKQYQVYLDSHQMKPCGHHAKKAQRFLQLISTTSETDSNLIVSTGAMAIRGFCTDPYGRTYVRPDQFELATNQHLWHCNPAILTCNARKVTYTCADYTCTLTDDSIWCKSEKGQKVVLLIDSARTKWAYVHLNEDQHVQEVSKCYLDDVHIYKELIMEGEGSTPPISVCKKIFEKYPLMSVSSSLYSP